MGGWDTAASATQRETDTKTKRDPMQCVFGCLESVFRQFQVIFGGLSVSSLHAGLSGERKRRQRKGQ